MPGPSSIGARFMTSPIHYHAQAAQRDEGRVNRADRCLAGDVLAYSYNPAMAIVGLEASLTHSCVTVDQEAVTHLINQNRFLTDQVRQLHSIHDQLRVCGAGLHTHPQPTVGSVQQSVDSLLKSFISACNNPFNGVYLLSGQKSQSPPCLEQSLLPALVARTPVDHIYYGGGDATGKIVIGGREVDEYCVSARDQAFAHTITAMRVLLHHTLDLSENDPQLSYAMQLMEEARPHYARVLKTVGEYGATLDQLDGDMKSTLQRSTEQWHSAFVRGVDSTLNERSHAAARASTHRSILGAQLHNISSNSTFR